VPGFDITVGKYTLFPNPFWGGAAFPLVVFGFLYLWPWIERRFTGDDAFHNLLERPRDNPLRTAIGIGVVSWVFIVFVGGSSDRVYVLFDLPYTSQIWAYRIIVWIVPLVAAAIAHRVCEELTAGEQVERDQREAQAEARLAETR